MTTTGAMLEPSLNPLEVDLGSGTAGAGQNCRGCPSSTGTSAPLLGMFGFTPVTCLELLDTLSLEQLLREAAFYRHYDPTFATTKTGSPYSKKSYLVTALNDLFTRERNKLLEKLISNPLLPEPLSVEIDKLQKATAALTLSSQHSLELATPSTSSTPPQTLESPVSLFNLDPHVMNFSVESFLAELESLGVVLQTVGNRLVAHFGRPYPYSGFTHPACEFPNSPILNRIMNALIDHDPDFSTQKYSLLLTLYPNGKSIIPRHHDNEPCISKDSKILTVVCGEGREITFTNTIGPLQRQSHKLDHGSLFIMSSSSQEQWQHEVPADPTCHKPRLTLTFRALDDMSPLPQKNHLPSPPPIAQPIIPRTQPTRATAADHPTPSDTRPPKPKRVLLLTDSNNIGLPTHHFPPSYVIIKKPLMQVTAIDDYSEEFSYSDIVVIASGINDISRHGFSGLTLADYLLPKLREYCTSYPSVQFIYSSLVPVSNKYPWLVQEVDYYNRRLFDFSMDNKRYGGYNFFLLDMASILHPHHSLAPRGNGIHITRHAQTTFKITLRSCLSCFIDPLDTPPGFTWPLRPQFKYLASRY